MSLTEVLKQIDVLQQQIDQHPQLGTDLLKKIQYRFRLDWNYHSNALEGNTLTRQETRSVMINNITVEGKPLKDVLEIRGHDNVITEVLRIGKGEKPLSEKRMKEIHKAILHEEDPEIMKQAGQWKADPNYLYNYKNERFDFTAPSEVADEIHKLLDTTNAALEKKSRPVVLIAFEFHLKFLTIHPFYDGNGRTARIFMNLLLIAAGYPPLIIKVEEKEQYNRYLADIQCYGGSPDLLYEFLGKLLIRSQELVLDAIAGKDISEPDDFEKELALIEQKYKIALETNNVIERDIHSIKLFFNQFLKPLEGALIQKLGKFDGFFAYKNCYTSLTTDEYMSVYSEYVECVYTVKSLNEACDYILDKEYNEVDFILKRISLNLNWNGSKLTGSQVFDLQYWIIFNFSDYNCTVHYGDPAKDYSRKETLLYSEQLSKEQEDKIVGYVSDYLLSKLKHEYKNLTGKDIL